MSHISKDSRIYNHLKKMYFLCGESGIPRKKMYSMECPNDLIDIGYIRYYHDSYNYQYTPNIFYITQEFIELMKVYNDEC